MRPIANGGNHHAHRSQNGIADAWPRRRGSALGGDLAFAQAKDSVTIGWPSDVPSWDPNQRFTPDAQPIFKMVFDQPLEQNPELELVPKLVTKWELAPDGLSMPVELRDDVMFHNGDKMTTEDFRYTFFERIKAGHKLDTANSWRKVDRHRDRVADQGGDEVQLARADRAAMAGLPRQLHRAEEIHGIGRPRCLPRQAGRHRSLQARRVPAQLAHRARAQRRLLGTEAEAQAHHLRHHQGSLRARRRGAVGPGRPDHQRAGARGRAARTASRTSPRRSTRSPASSCCRCATISALRTRTCGSQRIMRSTSRRCRRRSTAAPRSPLSVVATPGTPGYLDDYKFEYSPEKAKEHWRSPASARQAGEDQLRRDQRPVPERLRHRARDRADVEEGRHRRRARDDRIREIFRAQPRRQAAGGDALQLGQRHRRSGDLRRLPAQPEDAVLGLEGHGGRREGARAVQRSPTTTSASPATARSTGSRSRPARPSRCCRAC